MLYLQGKQFYYFCLPFSRGQLLKEISCFSTSKFFPIRLDSMSKSYIILLKLQANKNSVIQCDNINFVFGKEAGGVYQSRSVYKD